MRRSVWLLCSALLLACGPGGSTAGHSAAAPGEPGASIASGEAVADPAAALQAQRQAKLEQDFPLHGLVTGLQLKVRPGPAPEGEALGLLRKGSRIRLGPMADRTPTCASGWYPVAPQGFACAGRGIEVGEAPPASALATAPPARDAGLPYSYYFIKEPKVPEYHRLPTRADQRRAAAFLARYFELKGAGKERKASAFYRGELDKELPRPRVVRRFLDRGFFVAGAGIETRDGRRFVRTVRGAYVQEAKLIPRTGTAFHGVELGVQPGDEPSARAPEGATHPPYALPIAWATREAQPFDVSTREDGTLRMVAAPDVAPFARQQIVPWEREEHIGDVLLHRLRDGRYLKHWFLAVARRIDRPRGVGPDTPWVHVNLDQQTLVAYRGDTPVYATLVSSGLPGHDTPTGLFDIRAKHVAASMSDIGPDVGEDDRYSIEDVPWTQYFERGIALHGAFWHERFGLQRSHGCVNLAPVDAHWIFDHTWPTLAAGWHSSFAQRAGVPASKVWVTAK